MTKRISVAAARKDFAEIINRAAYAHERTVIAKHDTDVAAIISIDELKLLDALIERWEDEQDIAEAHAALLEAREERTPWETIKRDLGL